MLRGAVPILCKPGDVFIHNRLPLHGAFANTSPHPRCTLQFGFHRRSSVLGVETLTNPYIAVGQLPSPKNRKVRYDEDYIDRRCQLIMTAIDARRQKYPQEAPYVYAP